MTVLCNPLGPVAADVRAALPAPVVTVAEPVAALTALGAAADPLLVVGPDVPTSAMLGLVADTVVLRPGTGIVVVRHELAVEEIQQAVRAGAGDILAATDVLSLGAACERVLARAPRPRATARDAVPPTAPVSGPPAEGRVVTVFSAKGGCGKTTTATNLAATLAEGGARRVCLVDLDLEFGDVAITLQAHPRVTVADAPAADHLDEAAAASLLVPARPGLDLLLAPVAPGDAERIPAEVTARLLALLRRSHDWVVVDTPSQFSEHVLAALDASDHHVLVGSPELPSLKNLRLTLDMLTLLGYPAEARAVVLNRADDDNGLGPDDVERVVKAPIAVRVPSSRDVPLSINRGVPLAEDSPNHPVSRAVRMLAANELHAFGPISGRHRILPGLVGSRRRRTA